MPDIANADQIKARVGLNLEFGAGRHGPLLPAISEDFTANLPADFCSFARRQEYLDQMVDCRAQQTRTRADCPALDSAPALWIIARSPTNNHGPTTEQDHQTPTPRRLLKAQENQGQARCRRQKEVIQRA